MNKKQMEGNAGRRSSFDFKCPFPPL